MDFQQQQASFRRSRNSQFPRSFSGENSVGHKRVHKSLNISFPTSMTGISHPADLTHSNKCTYQSQCRTRVTDQHNLPLVPQSHHVKGQKEPTTGDFALRPRYFAATIAVHCGKGWGEHQWGGGGALWWRVTVWWGVTHW